MPDMSKEVHGKERATEIDSRLLMRVRTSGIWEFHR